MRKKLWVAITAHNPLSRLDSTFRVLRNYCEFDCNVAAHLYINYEAQDDVDELNGLLDEFRKYIDVSVVVASPGYSGWYLTWAHKNDLASAVLRNQYDYYIYQENDMLLHKYHFNYWVSWEKRLAAHNLEPGFVRFESVNGKRVAFDNNLQHSLTGKSVQIWGERGFSSPVILVVDHDIKLFSQVSNPYYGAMILTQDMADAYIRSQSFDPHASYELTGCRNWPIADRSSMGLAFEDLAGSQQHRRCVPLVKRHGQYVVPDYALIQHDDTKYTEDLINRNFELVECKNLFVL